MKVKKSNPMAILPTYAKPGDAGCDVRACLDEPIVLKPGERVLVPTGLVFAIPEGFECQVRSRSGLALKNGIMVLNSPGTIDSGYRGPVGVVLFNTNKQSYWEGHRDLSQDLTIRHGDRIAQLVFAPVTTMAFEEAEELDDTERGVGGFGSSGV